MKEPQPWRYGSKYKNHEILGKTALIQNGDESHYVDAYLD